MTMNYAIAFVVIALAVAAGQMLTQACLLARAKRRQKRREQLPTAPPPTPQAIEFNVALSGVDDVEAGLARIEAVIERISEAADGVPVTINNYYGKDEEPASVEAQSRIVARFAYPEATGPQSVDCYAVGSDQLRAAARELERMAAEFYGPGGIA